MKKILIYFVMLFIPTMLLSQETTHFRYETHTNSSNMAHIAIPQNINPSVDGISLVTGDEIAVFNT